MADAQSTEAPCACTPWNGAHGSFVPIFPDDVFETLEREEWPLDLHGTIPHWGRVRCRTCGRTYKYENLLTGCTFELEP
jgi:hypothetical protein